MVAENEFTSLLFPLLVAQQQGATVTEVPIDQLANCIDPEIDLVAFSLVDMQTGQVGAGRGHHCPSPSSWRAGAA